MGLRPPNFQGWGIRRPHWCSQLTIGIIFHLLQQKQDVIAQKLSQGLDCISRLV